MSMKANIWYDERRVVDKFIIIENLDSTLYRLAFCGSAYRHWNGIGRLYTTQCTALCFNYHLLPRAPCGGLTIIHTYHTIRAIPHVPPSKGGTQLKRR